MTTALAKIKKWRLLSFSTGDKIRVILDADKWDPDRAWYKRRKEVVLLDWHTMDFTYLVVASPLDLNKSKPEDIKSRVADLPNGLRELAEYIMDKYSASRSTETQKVTIKFTDLKDRISKFLQNWNSEDYKKYKEIYIKNWWDASLLWG